MSTELIINVASKEIDIALLEKNKLVELSKEKSNPKFSVGDIYLGRVRKIMPGLNAAFVDVGYEKDAFLHYLDLGPQFRSLQKFLDLVLSSKGKNISMQKKLYSFLFKTCITHTKAHPQIIKGLGLILIYFLIF